MPATMTMPILDLPQRPLTVRDYNAMIEAGILTEEDRVELLEGRLVEMTPPGPTHDSPINILTLFFVRQLADDKHVRVQCASEIGEYSAPQPDLAVVQARDDFYRRSHPTEKDSLLMIEVAVSSIRKDRELKARIYAQHGVPEYWIVLSEQDAIEVYRNPAGGRYTEMMTYTGGDVVSPATAPEVAIRVSDVLNPGGD